MKYLNKDIQSIPMTFGVSESEFQWLDEDFSTAMSVSKKS